MDVEMPPGVDFVERIDEVLSGCAALIIVMGPRWPDVADGDGRPRLHDPGDFVRREVAAALRRVEVVVIPALVGGAKMPSGEQLPEDLRPLTRRNALELSHGRWRYDVGRLHEALDGAVRANGAAGPPTPSPTPSEPLAPAPEPRPTPPPEPPARLAARPGAARLLLEGVLVAALAAFAGRWLGELLELSGTSAAAEILELTIQRGAAWGVVGLALAPWLGWRLGRTDLGYLAALGVLFGLLAGIVGGLIFGLPHKLPDPNVAATEKPGWGVLSLAGTGAMLGAMLGAIWTPRTIAAGLLGGLAGGVVCRLLLNWTAPFDSEMPGVAYGFVVLGVGIVAGALIALLAAEFALSPRSSPSATAAGSR